MSRFNTSTSHPIIPNAQQYMLHYKYVSIHSEDRDVKKFPSSSEFEIELPQDYVNVQSVKLDSWVFPHNYDVFTESLSNITLIFEIAPKYTISSSLYIAPEKTFIIQIESGTYTPLQMATEITNKMNLSVAEYLSTLPNPVTVYSDVVVEWNEVSNKLWFGNKNSVFTLNNGSSTYIDINPDFVRRNNYSQYTNWGLPYFLGFKYEDSESEDVSSTDIMYYKSDTKWITNTISGQTAQIIKTDYAMSLYGPTHFYLEISGMNNMDETLPYKAEGIYSHTNETNGIVNSAFAKIPIPLNATNQLFQTHVESYMLYNPPAEKIRRLRIKLRNHNNRLVKFNNYEFSITLQFALFLPQNEKKYHIYIPESVQSNSHR